MRKLWIKNREIVIVISCLAVCMFFLLWLLLGFIEKHPFISLTVCLISLAVFMAGNNPKR